MAYAVTDTSTLSILSTQGQPYVHTALGLGQPQRNVETQGHGHIGLWDLFYTRPTPCSLSLCKQQSIQHTLVQQMLPNANGLKQYSNIPQLLQLVSWPGLISLFRISLPFSLACFKASSHIPVLALLEWMKCLSIHKATHSESKLESRQS